MKAFLKFECLDHIKQTFVLLKSHFWRVSSTAEASSRSLRINPCLFFKVQTVQQTFIIDRIPSTGQALCIVCVYIYLNLYFTSATISATTTQKHTRAKQRTENPEVVAAVAAIIWEIVLHAIHNHTNVTLYIQIALPISDILHFMLLCRFGFDFMIC